MADHLCVTCAMCCDGTLYSRVPVTEAEKKRLGGGDNFYTKSDGTLRMRQGCRYLGRNGACHVYQERPKTCRTYKCRLLKRVEAGDLSEGEAVEIVTEIRTAETHTRKAVARAQGQEPFSTTMEPLPRLVAKLPKDSETPETRHAKLCHQHFENLVRLHIKPSFGT